MRVDTGSGSGIDFAHLYGRGWVLESENDYLQLLEKARPLSDKYIFTHFSAVEKRKHLPLEGNMPDYRTFAHAAAEFERQGGKELIVLVESPMREQDACRFRDEFESASQALAA